MSAPLHQNSFERLQAASDLELQHFDPILASKQWFRVKEVAAILGVGEATVILLADEGRLHHNAYSAGAGSRCTRVFPRVAILLFLLETKQYEAADHLGRVLALIRQLSAAELAIIEEKLPGIVANAERQGALTRDVAQRTR